MNFKYNSEKANQIEKKWQKYWEDHKTFVTEDFTADKEPYFIMDMFPYPSGAGLHVGHPLGYIATDVQARYLRMNQKNVLHALGYDAFGLPAEQHAIATGEHPRINTENNINNMRSQLKMLGLAHDPSRTFSTIDSNYIKWTQWIFSKIYDSYYDEDLQKARPITELVEQFKKNGTPDGEKWDQLSDKKQQELLNNYRLAYVSTSPVNWCPGLGTVLANEEVTNEGKSERGNFPVFTKNLKQWSMRITAYSSRLIDDLEMLDWPEKVKAMQKNWIGKSKGAFVDFKLNDVKGYPHDYLQVFTTRPDTLRGATFMVVAPEHPLVDFCEASKKSEVEQYVKLAKQKSAVDRQQDAGKKTGVYLGVDAVNPINGAILPIYTADYVLMGYGTGAIMAVPADDQRDREFAEVYGINIEEDYEKFESIEEACQYVERENCGKEAITYRLKDWLFSRQRYWGEPFPIIYDEDDVPYLLPNTSLPVLLPDVPDYQPLTFDPDNEDSSPQTPLSRNSSWVNIELDLGDGKGRRSFRRETNTMPNWAGSCWYYLRYLDAEHNGNNVVDQKLDEYWLGKNHNSTVGASGGVDLYVGGVEHAVLHLLYARFWHKVLYDLGFVSSPEPFHKLFNQGYIQAYAYTDNRGAYVDAQKVVEENGKFYFVDGDVKKEVTQHYGKMGKSLKNVVTPDDMATQFGSDTFRVYEMSMGPLDLSRPWETKAVIGAQRYLQRLWRLVVNEETGELVTEDKTMEKETLVELNKAIKNVREEMDNIRPNTAITNCIILANHLTSILQKTGSTPLDAVKKLILMTAPFAPHIAEELWSKIGNNESLLYADFPEVDEKYLVTDTVQIGVQVNGKVRGQLSFDPNATKEAWEKAALEVDSVKVHLDGKDIKKAIVIPGKIVNFVV